MTDSARYAALKLWLLVHDIVEFVPTGGDGEPFVAGNTFYGETFDSAVDTLPQLQGGN